VDVREFVRGIPGFASKNHPERIKAFGWFLHVHAGRERFSPGDITKCYSDADLDQPVNMGRFLQSLAEKRPPELLKDSRGYRLSQAVRERLNGELGRAEVVLTIEEMLTDLPGKIADEGERLFLSEALTCYRHGALRAAIVMTWNLAYDHVCRWVLADPARLAEFNSRIAGRNSKKAHIQIKNREDFEELKEDETVDILGGVTGVPGGVKKILKEKLGRRNTYAHPSLQTVGRPHVDEMIYDLVNNVVLYFKL
jgi:hypothetical protein